MSHALIDHLRDPSWHFNMPHDVADRGDLTSYNQEHTTEPVAFFKATQLFNLQWVAAVECSEPADATESGGSSDDSTASHTNSTLACSF